MSVDKLKTLRVTCLSISSKIEESNFPSHLWDDGPFSLLDNTEDMSLHKMESDVLEKLDWELCWITPWEFTDYCATKLSSKDYDKGELRKGVSWITKGSISFFLLASILNVMISL